MTLQHKKIIKLLKVDYTIYGMNNYYLKSKINNEELVPNLVKATLQG